MRNLQSTPTSSILSANTSTPALTSHSDHVFIQTGYPKFFPSLLFHFHTGSACFFVFQPQNLDGRQFPDTTHATGVIRWALLHQNGRTKERKNGENQNSPPKLFHASRQGMKESGNASSPSLFFIECHGIGSRPSNQGAEKEYGMKLFLIWRTLSLMRERERETPGEAFFLRERNEGCLETSLYFTSFLLELAACCLLSSLPLPLPLLLPLLFG